MNTVRPYRSFLDRPLGPSTQALPDAHRPNHTTFPSEPANSLGKKASKPLLGWLRRLKRSSTIGSSSHRTASELTNSVLVERHAPLEMRSPNESGPTSDYGRFVATNGIALMRGGSNVEDGSNDYQSIATSLDPFPPSFVQSSMSRSTDSTSDRCLSRFSSNLSNLVPPSASTLFADEDASLRAVPPSPTLSLTRMSSGSTANSSSQAGRYSDSLAAPTTTTAVTSLASEEGRSSLDEGPAIIIGPAAHIAQLSNPETSPQAGPGPSTTSQRHHQRQRSWAAGSAVSATISPLHLSVVASDDDDEDDHGGIQLSPGMSFPFVKEIM